MALKLKFLKYYAWGISQLLIGADEGKQRLHFETLKPSPGAKILDVGCATGNASEIFKDYAYTGIDVEPDRIRYAQRTYRPGEFAVMDATALRWPAGAFDQILVTGVLHHLEDDVVDRILAEMRRVLAPGGRALVMEDTAVGFKLNLLGALVHLADEGSFIREPVQYRALFERHFRVARYYQIRSGVCDYEVFVLE